MDALSRVVQVDPRYAADHQMVVLDCLEDPDETLRRKTLDLLFKMTNPQNVEVVVSRMMDFLRSTRDETQKADLVVKVTRLAEQYAHSNTWYIETINNVLECSGESIPGAAGHNLLRVLVEGTGEDDAADEELRSFAVEKYLHVSHLRYGWSISVLCSSSMFQVLRSDAGSYLPSGALVCVAAWVIGEYSYLRSGMVFYNFTGRR